MTTGIAANGVLRDTVAPHTSVSKIKMRLWHQDAWMILFQISQFISTPHKEKSIPIMRSWCLCGVFVNL